MILKKYWVFNVFKSFRTARRKLLLRQYKKTKQQQQQKYQDTIMRVGRMRTFLSEFTLPNAVVRVISSLAHKIIKIWGILFHTFFACPQKFELIGLSVTIIHRYLHYTSIFFLTIDLKQPQIQSTDAWLVIAKVVLSSVLNILKLILGNLFHRKFLSFI